MHDLENLPFSTFYLFIFSKIYLFFYKSNGNLKIKKKVNYSNLIKLNNS